MGVNSLAFSKMNKSQDGDRPKQMSNILAGNYNHSGLVFFNDV